MTENKLPNCPECTSEYTYEVDGMYNCPECGHIWSTTQSEDSSEDGEDVIRDANGEILQDGDTVTIIKDLKVKGASTPLKVGTKVKNIKLVGGDHDIDCKIPGFGSMGLKSEYVKKV